MKNLLYLATLTLLLWSCSQIDNSPQRSIFPTSQGNKWMFIDTFNSYNGPRADTSSLSFYYAYKEGNNSGAYSFQSAPGGRKCFLYTDSEGNCVECLYVDNALVYKSVQYKINAKKGDSWNFKTCVFSTSDYSAYRIIEPRMYCVSSDTLISSPAGVFKCKAFSYSPDDGSTVFVLYLAENVGPVKMLKYEEGFLFHIRTLTDYSVYIPSRHKFN